MDARALIAVALGGAVGAVLRFVVGQLFLQRFGPGFPWGTLFINISGSLLIGIIAELAVTRAFGMTPLVRTFAAVGVLGGYTTFSTFSLETVTLFGEGGNIAGMLYVLGSLVLGVMAAYGGQIVARLALR